MAATGNNYPHLFCWKRVPGGVRYCVKGKEEGPIITDADAIQMLVDSKQIEPE